MHAKPCGLLNVAGFYDALLAFLAHARAEEFLRPTHRRDRRRRRDPVGLLDRLAAWQPPDVPRWITPDEA